MYCKTFLLLQLLRKCILTMTRPTIDGPLRHPPFERPSIAKAITNFVFYKFSHLAQRVSIMKNILFKLKYLKNLNKISKNKF